MIKFSKEEFKENLVSIEFVSPDLPNKEGYWIESWIEREGNQDRGVPFSSFLIIEEFEGRVYKKKIAFPVSQIWKITLVNDVRTSGKVSSDSVVREEAEHPQPSVEASTISKEGNEAASRTWKDVERNVDD